MEQFAPGTIVEYFSASLQEWIKATVVRPGLTAGTYDLDCKNAVEAKRIRSIGVSTQRVGCSAESHAKPATATHGQAAVPVGEICLYDSSAHGWVPATVLGFNADDHTYDLDVKQHAAANKVYIVADGDNVEYKSTSTDMWVPAKVLRKGQNLGIFDLDCKLGVNINRLRPSAHATTNNPVTMQAIGQAHAGYSAVYTESQQSRSGCRVPPTALGPLTVRFEDPKLQQLRQAVESEDAAELRKRMESKSALNMVGEELDRAAHALWTLEARPAALADLHREVARSNIQGLQAALEAAAAVGVEASELKPAAQRLRQLKAQMWRYQPGDSKHMDLRRDPQVDGARVRQRLNPGEVFQVAEEKRGEDGILFLRLADGRGWAFDKKPSTGIMCVRNYPDESEMQNISGDTNKSVPLGQTVADLQRQHKSILKPSNGTGCKQVSEDSPGEYVISIDQTGVTPTVQLDAERPPIAMLDVGTVVKVSEVVHRPDLKRVRGRIRPAGWITLLHTESGKRWAEKRSSGRKWE